MSFLEKTKSVFNFVATKQENYGIKKYGHELQPHDSRHDWLNMTIEEMVDGFKYLVAERERRDENLKQIINLTNLIADGLSESDLGCSEYKYIRTLLESVQGHCKAISKNLENDTIETDKYELGKKISL